MVLAMRWLLILLTLALASPALAERPDPPRFTAADYGLTAGLGGIALVSDLLGPPEVSRWRGGVIMDEGMRDSLRLSSSKSRALAADISDGMVLALQGFVLSDAAVMAGDASDSGYRVLMVDLQSYAASAALISLAKSLVGRERPFVRDCVGDDVRCNTRETHKSFLSGHTAMAFTAAGLVCVHHHELALYGGGVGDSVACGVALGVASTTAILRMMADKHYATDVVAGLAVGTFAGFVLPYLLHYGDGDYDARSGDASAFPWLSAGGTF